MGCFPRGRKGLCQNHQNQGEENMEKIDLPSVSDPLWMPIDEYRQYLKKHGLAEERLTDEQVAAVQDFILRFSQIICDMIFAGELPIKETD